MMKQNVASMLSLVDEKFVREADPTQNKPKQKLGWRKLTAIAASICVFVSALAISILIPAMNRNEPPVGNVGFEYGLEFEAESHATLDPDFCGIKSNSNQFDINDVTLDFYFGSAYCVDIDENPWLMSIPEFDIYFTDANNNMSYLVRHVEENYISSKYAITLQRFYKKTAKYTVLYSHSEKITIPSELFVADQGRIGFRLAGVNVLAQNPEYRVFNGIWIYYKKDRANITLTKAAKF